MVEPTAAPTTTFYPTPSYKSFDDGVELRAAVMDYLGGVLSLKEEVQVKYGRRIGDWDVSRVENMSFVFDIDLSTADFISDFNEPIGDWNTSK